MTPEALEEWRASPVTMEIRNSLRWVLDRKREAATNAYWDGRPWSEAERLALLREQGLWSDLFEASAEDFGMMMEMMNDAPVDGVQRGGQARPDRG